MPCSRTTGVNVPSRWQSPSKIPPLSFEGVQVWVLELASGLPAGALDRSFDLLSSEEKRRADAVRVASVREEFVAARGLLRSLLGSALGVDPAAVPIVTKRHGKPCIAPPARVEFNVSHSDGVILIALSRASCVGIDVEYLSDEFSEAEELMGIARESFHADEFNLIARTAPGRERLLAFYVAWTRREAVAKADGRGIASLLNYEVFRADEFGEQRVSLAGSPEGLDDSRDVDYFVQTPQIGPHHLAAVASRKPRQALGLFNARSLRG